MLLNNVILSVAGSGKTYTLCNLAQQNLQKTDKKILLITYTNRGLMAIEKEYKKQNSGIIDKRIEMITWYRFLLNEMIKPYQRYILGDYSLIKTLDFTQQYGHVNYNSIGTKKRYISGDDRIKANYASEMCVQLDSGLNGKVIERLEKIYSHIYVDELQDYVGCDLDIFELLIHSSIRTVFVGDHKQATFSTHNTKKNRKKSGRNIRCFVDDMKKQNLINIENNIKSRRCNKYICSFANYVYPSSICMESCCNDVSEHDGIFLIKDTDVELYTCVYSPTFLRYNINSGYDKYYPLNYGECKGETFDRIAIIPNEPFLNLIRKGVALSSPDKYYVAITRARYSVVIIVHELVENTQFKKTLIVLNGQDIEVSEYIFG